MPRPYLHYDVFTGTPLVGNQLAVFTDAVGLSTEQMQAIAREMNFAESTFMLPSERSDTDVRMRIFTPHLEMPMAGHPTVGSTFALAHTGAIANGRPDFVFGLNIGPVPVELEWTQGRLRFVWMTQSPPLFGEPIADRAGVVSAIGLTVDDLVPELPVQLVSCGVPYVIVVARDIDAVDRAVPDIGGFRRLCAEYGAETAIFLFALAGSGRSETVYSRMFAPGHGVVEDPATGSASGPLGCYLVRHRLVTPDVQHRIISAQGVAMGRASTIHVDIDGDAEAMTRVRVGGEAVLVGTGELLL